MTNTRTGGTVVKFPDERRIAVELIADIRSLRQFLELADDLAPFREPMVQDDLLTITAILDDDHPWGPPERHT